MDGWKPRNLILHDYGGTPEDKDGVFNPYHALVYPSGKVRYRNPSNPYGAPAPHAYRMNNDAIGLSYAGPVGSKPTPEALGAIRGEYDKINSTFPGIKPMSHGEAYQTTRGTPQQASRDGRGLDEAIWRHDLLGTTPTAAASGPVPMAQRSLTSYAGLGGNDMAPRGMAAGRSGLGAISPEWERDKMSVGALPQAMAGGQQYSTGDEDEMLKQLAGQTIQPYRPGWAGVAGIGNSIMGGFAMKQLKENAAKKQAGEQEAWKAATGMAGNPQQAIQQMMQTAPPGSAPQQYALRQMDTLNTEQRQKAAASEAERARQSAPDYQLGLDLKRATIEKMKAEAEQGRGGKVGLVPVYGRDADGNPVVMQPSPTGELVRSRMPEGVQVDLGLKSAESAYGKKVGDSQAQAQVDLPKSKLNAERLTRMIDNVANDPYLDKMTGLSGYLPNISPDSKRVEASLKQIGGATFLQAFESLKGGGAITEVEGQKATDSLNRLSTTTQGTPEYRTALAEFRKDVQDLAALAEQKASAGYGRRNGATTPDGGGGWTDMGGVRIREKR